MRQVEHTSFVIERTFDADLDRVYRAFSDPDAKRAWFACHDDMEILEHALDVRPGGAEVNRIRSGAGKEHLFLAHYLDVVPRERLIYAYAMHVDGVRLSASLVTNALRADGPRTVMTYTEQIAILDGLQPVDERIHGTELGFDMLERALASGAV